MDKKKKIPEKEKMKKIFLQPSRVKDFHCIGSECEDLCCLGKWTVFIDKDSYNFYKSKLDKEEKDIFRKYMKLVLLPSELRYSHAIRATINN